MDILSWDVHQNGGKIEKGPAVRVFLGGKHQASQKWCHDSLTQTVQLLTQGNRNRSYFHVNYESQKEKKSIIADAKISGKPAICSHCGIQTLLSSGQRNLLEKSPVDLGFKNKFWKQIW